MYEEITYEMLVKRMLQKARTTDSRLDTREGSMAWLGIAPAAVELQNLYLALDNVLTETFISTASREYLILRGEERGLTPYSATPAILQMEITPVTVELNMNTRFNIGALNYAVTNDLGSGKYEITCETAGETGNDFSAAVVPIDYIDGLETCTVTALLVPGEDEESTEAFRQRVLAKFQSQAFGGNQADYTEKVSAMDGVASVKVHPVWNEDISPSSFIPGDAVSAWYESIVGTLDTNVAAWLTAIYTAAKLKKITVGGAVKLVILASNNAAPSETLLGQIQTAVDPTQNAGEGLGLAPIGHVVSVVGVGQTVVNITLSLTCATGWSWDAVQSYVEDVIDTYFEELAEQWPSSEYLTVRISQIESRILSECAAMITDIGGTKLNGTEANLVLDADSIPVRGSVSNG